VKEEEVVGNKKNVYI